MVSHPYSMSAANASQTNEIIREDEESVGNTTQRDEYESMVRSQVTILIARQEFVDFVYCSIERRSSALKARLLLLRRERELEGNVLYSTKTSS
jgi:hypothetical protein